MMQIHSLFFRFVFLALLGCPSVLAAPPKAKLPAPVKLIFGVAPQQAVTELARIWTPFLGYLSRKTGYSFQFRSATDVSTFERRIAVGEYDFAYYNPLLYATSREIGYQAIAKERDTRLTGIVVVPKESPHQDLKDIDGATVAFPAPTAFAAAVLPQMMARKIGINITPKYVSSHESVYRTVAQGLYPAGGGIVKTFENVEPAVQDKLRILWKSQAYTAHPVAAHPRVPPHVAQRVLDALAAMEKDPEGLAMLKLANFKGFVAARDSDYDDIRALNVNINQSGAVEYGKK